MHIKGLGVVHASAVVAFLAFAAFAGTLQVGFLWDDHEMIENNSAVRSPRLADIPAAFGQDVFAGKGDPYYRPLQTLMNMADYAAWNGRPFGFHLTNISFHVLSSVLLLLLLRRLQDDPLTAFLASAAFAVHPVVVEQLLIIAGRAELMAFAFTLAALLAATSRSRTGYVFSIFLFPLALFSKETGLAFPLFLALCGWYRRELRLRWEAYIPYAVGAGIYLGLRKAAVGTGVPVSIDTAVWFVTEFPATLWSYVRIILFPFDLHSHRRFDAALWRIVAGWILIASIALFGVLRRSRFAALAAGWFLIGLAPKVPVMPANALLLDHWAYPAGVGLYLAGARGVAHLFRGRRLNARVAAAVSALFLGGWFGLSRWYVDLRGTDEKLYAWALRFPSSSVVRYNLGLLRHRQGRHEEAERLFRESLAINPESALTHNALALTIWRQGRVDEALGILDEQIEANPDFTASYLNKAIILRGDAGLSAISQALARDPGNARAWELRGALLAGLGRYDEAAGSLREAVQLDPRNVAALSDLGAVLAMTGRSDDAIAIWRRALEIAPGDPTVEKNLKWIERRRLRFEGEASEPAP